MHAAVVAMNPSAAAAVSIAGGSPSSQYTDVIKVGFLRKGKRSKKRFFVLHQDGYKSPARIDYYDSDKRFYQGSAPKLSVPLKQCFNINKKADSKLKHCIAIYTRNDCLLLGCDDEHDQEAWLQTLLGVLVNTQSTGDVDDMRRPIFEHAWNVKIQKNRGITEKTPYLAGHFRFCLDCYSVYFYRAAASAADDDEDVYEFPLVYISNYGHQGNMFFLRIGRSALTGSGELWMNTEDVMDAASIHETMKQILEENHELRRRNMAVEPRASFYSISSMRSNSLTGGPSTSRSELIGNSGDPRSRSISESEKNLQTLRSHLSDLKSRSSMANAYPPTALSYSRSASHSPSQRHNFASAATAAAGGGGNSLTDGDHSVCAYSTDSVATGSTSSDFDRTRFATNSLDKKQHVDLELISRAMAGGSCDSSTPLLNGKCCSNSSVTSLTTAAAAGGGGYESSNSSTVITHYAEVHSPAAVEYSDKLRRMTLDSGCVDAAVSPRGGGGGADSYLVPDNSGTADYTPMAPSPSSKSSCSKLADNCSCSNIDDIQSCCRGDNQPPSRAYSCGSKPQQHHHQLQPQQTGRHQPLSCWLKKLPLPGFDDRKRAHSFGNWNKYGANKNNYFPISDVADDYLRHRSDSLGASDEYVDGSRSRIRQVLRSRLLNCKFSSGSEDMVEMDFGGTESSSFGLSHSGSLSSADSVGRSRANSAAGAMVHRQAWFPRIGQINEQEMRPSARLVQDLLEQEPKTVNATTDISNSEYVPMSPYKSTVEPSS